MLIRFEGALKKDYQAIAELKTVSAICEGNEWMVGIRFQMAAMIELPKNSKVISLALRDMRLLNAKKTRQYA